MVAVNDPHGTRSADLIWEYSLYLTALPVLVSATGLTSWMFAVEGTVANVYLLSLAHAFRQVRPKCTFPGPVRSLLTIPRVGALCSVCGSQDSQSNAKARKVFLCSLWYLPLLLAAYVFHSRVWNEHEQASVVVDADGVAVASSGDRSNDEAAEQHGVTLLTRAKQALRAVCVHEVVAAYNMGGSKDKDPEESGSRGATAAAGGDASGGLCVKIKADKAVGAASASSAKAVAAAIDEALPTPRSRD